MIDSVTRIALNLQETNTMVTVRAKQGDTGRKLLIHLTDGSIPYPIDDDCYAVFTAAKPDGTKLHNPCTIHRNAVVYEFTEQTCAAPGTLHCEIRLYGADRKLITSACFLITVLETVYRDGDEVSSEGEMNTLDDLICQAAELLKESGSLLHWQGSWDREAAYGRNDLVLHRKVLYVARQDVPQGTEPGSDDRWISIAGMGSGSAAADYVVQDTAPEDTSVLWVDPTDNHDDGFREALNTALTQAKDSGAFDGRDYVLTEADKSEIAQMAADMVEIPESDSGGLPEVTADNNGAFLRVVDGAWAAATLEMAEGVSF